MADRRPHVLIVGLSTRAFAASAARAGYRVTAVDAFGDVDLRTVARVIPLRRDGGTPYGRWEAVTAARSVTADLMAYTSNLENHPTAVAALMRGRRLLGNAPDVLQRVRNPITLMRELHARGLATPATRGSAPPAGLDGLRWLLKPRQSGGGHGTVAWRRGRRISRRAYLQERIVGVPGSIVFAADGRRAVPLGVSRQLVGERAFGARGFRYCGSLLASSGAPLFERQAELCERATALARAATEAFGLRGVNGLDFIARRGIPLPIELNPRYSASMELVERATGLSVFSVHMHACNGWLPEAPQPPARVFGKGIVFARRAIVAVDLARFAGEAVADVPHPGERIGRGHAVCTVLADADDGARCARALAEAAAAIHGVVEPPARGAA